MLSVLYMFCLTGGGDVGNDSIGRAGARAALQWLDMKAHLTEKTADGRFVTRYVGLRRGLKRYNGNKRIDANGKPYQENYVDLIFRLVGGNG